MTPFRPRFLVLFSWLYTIIVSTEFILPRQGNPQNIWVTIDASGSSRTITPSVSASRTISGAPEHVTATSVYKMITASGIVQTSTVTWDPLYFALASMPVSIQVRYSDSTASTISRNISADTGYMAWTVDDDILTQFNRDGSDLVATLYLAYYVQVLDSGNNDLHYHSGPTIKISSSAPSTMSSTNQTGSVAGAGVEAPAAQEPENLRYNSDSIIYIFFGRDQRDPQNFSSIWIRMTRADLDSPDTFRRALTQYIHAAIDLGVTHYYPYFGDILIFPITWPPQGSHRRRLILRTEPLNGGQVYFLLPEDVDHNPFPMNLNEQHLVEGNPFEGPCRQIQTLELEGLDTSEQSWNAKVEILGSAFKPSPLKTMEDSGLGVQL
ncbi:hypothetical protein VSDG_09199 [Cytospora chrysosperma]|uniref:Uncharacterized protein n=1 Tax=Cytospora chrysosperma TaxID=252740 RepID=A0A423VAM4_CYTCH|nr:hypothetical protein VSDG_09199 [Valsa sordida]